jgi:hypothetical protein
MPGLIGADAPLLKRCSGDALARLRNFPAAHPQLAG